jgi:hypothetical protein
MMKKMFTLVVAATVSLATYVQAQEDDVYNAAFDLCTDGNLSINDRLTALKAAGWAPATDFPTAAEYQATYGLLGFWKNQPDLAERLEAASNNVADIYRDKLGYALPWVHPDWPGTLDVYSEVPPDNPDAKVGGTCLFLTSHDVGDALVTGPMALVKPPEIFKQSQYDQIRVSIYAFSAVDSSEKEWLFNVVLTHLDVEKIEAAIGRKVLLRSAVQIRMAAKQ